MHLSRLVPARLREGASVLRRRDFRNVFLAQTVSVFGDGITPVALTFAVLDLTGSGTDLGLVLAAQSVPLVALALVGGVWADRLPRATLMMGSDLVRAAVQITGAVLLLTGTAHIWQLAVLGGVYVLRGVAVGILVAVWNTTLQTQIARESLGRVTAWDWMASLALWPVGLAVAGPLAEEFGVTTMCWVTGGLGLLAAFWVLLVRDVWRLRPAPVRVAAAAGAGPAAPPRD